MFDAEWSLDGFDGSWHYVRQVSGCDRMRELLTGAGVMSDRQARDFLDAGDGQFSAVNPGTGAAETYAVIGERDGRLSMYRKISA